MIHIEHAFTRTAHYKKMIDHIFRGMAWGGSVSSIVMVNGEPAHHIEGGSLDIHEWYATKAGILAYETMNCGISAGLLAMVINAPVGNATWDVVRSMRQLGVDEKACEAVLPVKKIDGTYVSLRTMWTSDCRQHFESTLREIPPEAQVGILAHVSTVLERMKSPDDRAPDSIIEAATQTALTLLPTAHDVCPILATRIADQVGINPDSLHRGAIQPKGWRSKDLRH